MQSYLLTTAVILVGLATSTSYGKNHNAPHGVWKLDNYTDEFGDRISKRFIKSDFIGTFSNSATTGSRLLGLIQISKAEGINFALIEYGSHLVKGWRSRGGIYTVRVKAGGKKYSFLGELNYGSVKIKLISPSVLKYFSHPSDFIKLLTKHSKLKVLVVGKGSSSYRFDVNAMGFSKMFKKLGISNPKILNTGKNKLGHTLSSSLTGVKGVRNKKLSGLNLADLGKKSSGVNLSELGLNVGQVRSKRRMSKGFGRGAGRKVAVNMPPGDPVVSGGLTAGEVSSVIRKNLNQIRHCYEQYLKRGHSKSGKVSVKFIVNKGGRISSVAIRRSNISDLSLRNCITTRIKTWKFPRPRGGSNVEVSYPFIFNPL